MSLSIIPDAEAQSVTKVKKGYLVQFDETLHLSESVSSVVISSFPGAIEIVRTNNDEIRYQESIRLRTRDGDDARSEANRISVAVREVRRRIEFRGRGDHERGRSIKLWIPAGLQVEASSSSGDVSLDGGTAPVELATGAGDISVSDLDAYLDVRTGAGDVDISDVAGPLTVESGGGDIALDQIGAEIYVLTGGGDIELSDIDGDVAATTGGGGIEGNRINGDVDSFTGGGDIEFMYVKGDLDVNTSGGSIELDDIIGRVRATTSGGDIDVRQLRGSLVAETLAGDVDIYDLAGNIKVVSKVGDVFVRVNPDVDVALDFNNKGFVNMDFIDIRAENGSIDLRIPPGFDADLRVDLGYYGTLETDQFKGDLNWSRTRRNEEDGRIRRATGTINRGGVRIQLSVGSGDVTIKDR